MEEDKNKNLPAKSGRGHGGRVLSSLTILPEAPPDEPGTALAEKRGVEVLDAPGSDGGKDGAPKKRRLIKLARSGSKVNPAYFSLALATIVFAVVGLAFSVVTLVGTVSDTVQRNPLKRELAMYIYPVVICDPSDFANAAALHPVTVVSSSLWTIILARDTDKYANEYGSLTIPALDVEQEAYRLFGKSAPISHQNINNGEVVFEYFPDINSYVVPEKPSVIAYEPSVVSLEESEDLLVLTVDYVLPNPLRSFGEDFRSEPVKTMKYTIERYQGQKTILSGETVSAGQWGDLD